jgi:uncharacterized protein
MKRFFWLSLYFLLCSTALNAQVQNENYIKDLKKERKEKDQDFKDVNKTPLATKDINHFKGLKYFKPNKEYRISAKLIREVNPDTILMKTTTERLPVYVVYGKAYFTVNDSDFVLTVYRNVGLMSNPEYEDYLFIPFTDETNGEETYGGGRYIDARITSGDNIVIDFNRAYNPYCVYNKKYSCPIPPSDNHLNTRVLAGEMNYR